LIATRARRTTTGVVVVLSILVILALTLAYFTVKRYPPIVSQNRIELILDKGEPLQVSFVGDSLDYGLFASKKTLGFHELMVEEWRKDGSVADESENTIGGTAAGALTTPNFPRDQQLYVVELGTNDARLVDYRDFRTQYARLLDRIRNASPDAALVCVGVWRPKEIADTFDTIIKDLCEVRGGVFRALRDLAEDEDLRGPAGVATFGGKSDAFHPNDRGHRMIADRVLDAISVNRQG
jgi:acyl-CoA thioesterase I